MEKRRSLISLVMVAMYTLLLTLTGCYESPIITYKYDGFLHPSSPKLHNIQVVNSSDFNAFYERIYYFSFSDSTYHNCYVPEVFKADFTVGKIIK